VSVDDPCALWYNMTTLVLGINKALLSISAALGNCADFKTSSYLWLVLTFCCDFQSTVYLFHTFHDTVGT